MPRDPFQLSSVVTSQYSKIFFLEKVSGKSPVSFPESLPIWVKSKIKIKTGIIFIFQWNSHHHFLNAFKHNYVLSKNLGYEWIVKRDEDCWYVCGEKGGSCSACHLNGDDGYCCSQTKLNSNGNCPTEAVNAMISSSDSVIEMHHCVRKISSGKWLLSSTVSAQLKSLFLINIS